MISKKIFKFFWAIGWMLFGAAIGLHWQFEGATLGVFAILSLVIGDLILSGINFLRARLSQ